MLLLALIFGFCLFTFATHGFGGQSVPMVQQENAPRVDEILDRMKAHDEWQDRYLIEYRAHRKFSATNLRFKEEATLEVTTTFHRPDMKTAPADSAFVSGLLRDERRSF